jgi:hypothetical protein
MLPTGLRSFLIISGAYASVIPALCKVRKERGIPCIDGDSEVKKRRPLGRALFCPVFLDLSVMTNLYCHQYDDDVFHVEHFGANISR